MRGIIQPTTDSEIKFAVWLPAARWNGRYRQEGNGGWAGNIPFQAMIDPLRRGYVTAATDDGHEGSGADWAVGHPEKLIDFGIERFTRIGPRTVEWTATIDDPTVWPQPWTYSIPMTEDDKQIIYEYACHEGSYGLANLLSARRADERKAPPATRTGRIVEAILVSFRLSSFAGEAYGCCPAAGMSRMRS